MTAPKALHYENRVSFYNLNKTPMSLEEIVNIMLKKAIAAGEECPATIFGAEAYFEEYSNFHKKAMDTAGEFILSSMDDAIEIMVERITDQGFIIGQQIAGFAKKYENIIARLKAVQDESNDSAIKSETAEAFCSKIR